MPNISASVGKGGVNNKADVTVVQHLLNVHVRAMGLPPLDEDGRIGDNTNDAIVRYQQMVLGNANPDGRIGDNTNDAITRYQQMVLGNADPDGRIDVGGGTWKALAAGRSVAPPPAPPAPAAQLSGAAWWHANQANYPNSAKLADLASPFREKAMRFIAALQAAGAQVSVTSTLRNPIRAYLMHYSGTIASGADAPSAVPAKAGCPIVWDHGNLASSRAGAREMMENFGMAHIAALHGRHIDGHAVDMNIGWSGTLSIKDASGATHAIGAPRNGVDNRALHAVGASYGVHKLIGDDPHWSIDGH